MLTRILITLLPRCLLPTAWLNRKLSLILLEEGSVEERILANLSMATLYCRVGQLGRAGAFAKEAIRLMNNRG